MRHRTFKQFVESGAGDRQGSPEFERELERSTALARELHEKVLLPFLARHQEDDDFLLPTLLRAAALHAMVGSNMTPDDFGEFARIVAEASAGEAAVLRAKAGALLGGPGKQGRG